MGDDRKGGALKINVLSPYRKGGPYQWSEGLVRELNRHHMSARHVHRYLELLASPFFQDCDVVHTTIPIPFSLWNKPILLTIHGDYRRERTLWSPLYPLAIKKADRVTVPSEFLKRELGIEKAVVIPNGIEADFLTEKTRWNSDNLRFVTVTNFNFEDKAKGVETLIGILDEFRRRNNIDCSFEIAGAGRFLKRMKQKYKDKPYLNFRGFSQDVKSVLSENDVFLYYSFHDNFPIAILEAMAHGLPVLSHDVGAISEVIATEKEGYLSKNEDAFLKNLERLVEHPDDLPLVRRRAFQKVKDAFSWDKIFDLYKKCYEEISR